MQAVSRPRNQPGLVNMARSAGRPHAANLRCVHGSVKNGRMYPPRPRASASFQERAEEARIE